jgi:predicted secreted Zn-dependent protease
MNRKNIGRRLPEIALCAVLCGAVPITGSAQTIPGVVSIDPLKALPNVSVEYYTVTGTDEASISASLDQNAPVRPDGSKAMASTRYTPNIQSLCAPVGPTARVKAVKIRLGAVVKLPRLADETAVPERVLTRWRSFVAGLREHEAGHIRIEYQQLRGMEAAVVGSKCSERGAKYDAIDTRSRALQKAYDEETNSGATQGATLRWQDI